MRCSALRWARRSGGHHLGAFKLGSVDFVTKPKLDVTTGTIALADELIAKGAPAVPAWSNLDRYGQRQ